MEKIYIATTTLNFNNILATESISPKSFYEKRNFGYKRFEKIELNNFDNILVGYSKLPIFDINDEENDNYPLILEISKDIIKDIEVIGKNDNIEIYKISSTIYLNPNKVKFLFLNEEDKKITLIKAEPSISTKCLPLYKNSIDIYKKNDSFKWNKRYLLEIEDKPLNIEQKIEFDRNINRIKGFYYCYSFGEVYIKKLQQSNINQKLNNYNEIMFNKKEVKKLKDEIEESLKEIDIYNDIDITNKERLILTSFNKHNNSAELYKNIINSIIELDSINNKEEFKTNKLKLLIKIGDNFKETFGENDETVEYIRSLIDHIYKFKPFDINKIDKEKYLLKSISCFILRGDDLEKLLDFLKENNLKTFKISFGLWGALFGFSTIPKTISNILFEEKTKDIINIQKFLEDMYRKIHSFDIQENIKIEFIQEKIIKYKDCNGKRDLQGNELDDDFKLINNSSIVSKMIDYAKNPFSNNTNLDNIIYEFIKDNPNGIKLSEAIKKIKVKTQKEFKVKYQNDNRFEFYKDGRTEMIKIKSK
jgi:hypothetical protein